MAQQTAVEWLEEELADKLKLIVLNNDYGLMEKIFQKAKTMEKEQIMTAFKYGKINNNKNWADEYYNETFKQIKTT